MEEGNSNVPEVKEVGEIEGVVQDIQKELGYLDENIERLYKRCERLLQPDDPPKGPEVEKASMTCDMGMDLREKVNSLEHANGRLRNFLDRLCL